MMAAKDDKPKSDKESKDIEDSLEETKLNKIAKAALESHLIQHAEKKKNQQHSVSEIMAINKEFLSSFVVLGYNYDGDPMSIMAAANQQEADSLVTLINKALLTATGPLSNN